MRAVGKVEIHAVPTGGHHDIDLDLRAAGRKFVVRFDSAVRRGTPVGVGTMTNIVRIK